MVFHGFERFWGQDVSHPLAACGSLWHPVPADWIPPMLRFQILEAWCLDAGCWKDWNGLEEVTEVTEGIGMGGGDWKKFPHARASAARRISTCIQC